MTHSKSCIYLLLFSFVYITAMAQNDKIEVNVKNSTIKEVFEQIEAQSKYTIAYNLTKFNTERKISVTLKNKPLKEILEKILKGSGFTFKINNKHIVIIPESKENNEYKRERPKQTIRGVVRDANSGEPLEYTTVQINNTAYVAITDSLGRFQISNVPIGRYDLLVSSAGYKTLFLREQLLTSAKESYNEISLHEKVLMLNEVIVRPAVNKQQPLNSMALAGARMFSVEEANRFAGGFDDPARLVSSFAGVAGNLSSNSISIHGNSPQFLQWRLEDVDRIGRWNLYGSKQPGYG
jgi:DNA-binding TFAR19-related protein (PDSD5 family)